MATIPYPLQPSNFPELQKIYNKINTLSVEMFGDSLKVFKPEFADALTLMHIIEITEKHKNQLIDSRADFEKEFELPPSEEHEKLIARIEMRITLYQQEMVDVLTGVGFDIDFESL